MRKKTVDRDATHNHNYASQQCNASESRTSISCGTLHPNDPLLVTLFQRRSQWFTSASLPVETLKLLSVNARALNNGPHTWSYTFHHRGAAEPLDFVQLAAPANLSLPMDSTVQIIQESKTKPRYLPQVVDIATTALVWCGCVVVCGYGVPSQESVDVILMQQPINHRHQGAWYRREHPAPSRLPTALLKLSDTRTCPEMSTGVQLQN